MFEPAESGWQWGAILFDSLTASIQLNSRLSLA
jgi:hypothetical protein